MTQIRSAVNPRGKGRWCTIRNTITPFAIVSLICGGVILACGGLDLWAASTGTLRVSIRLDPVILKAENPEFDGGLENHLPVWYAASVTGMFSAFLQIVTSFLFIANIFIRKELTYLAKIWMVLQLIVSLLLLIIMGGVYIAGFAPNVMIYAFGMDVILIHVLVLLSMPIVRREGKQPTIQQLHETCGGPVFTALLLL